MLLSDYVGDVQELLHDSTNSVWPLSRMISRINDARIDTARDMHCIRQLVTGIQLLPGVEIYNLNGAVAGATVTSGGSNYGGGSTVPVTFSAAPSGGVTALGIGNLVGGSLTSITMTRWGVGYTSIPTITVGGAGSGAAASAVCLFQSNPLSSVIGLPLTTVSIIFIWNTNNRPMLKYLNFSMFQAYARALGQVQLGPPGIWTEHQQQKLVYIQTPPDQLYLSEWDMIFLPAPLVALTDLDTQITEPWARAVQFKAGEYLSWKLQGGGRVKEFEKEYDKRIPQIITTTGGYRIKNPYSRSMQRRAMA